jgi:acetyl esterase
MRELLVRCSAEHTGSSPSTPKGSPVSVDPRIEALFADIIEPESIEGGDPADLRARVHAIHDRLRPILTDPGPTMAHVFDDMVFVNGDRIRVRVYRPHQDTSSPVHVYLHGGGWWQGTVDHVDPQCRRLAKAAGCVLVSVEYRLAPEHRFPIPLEDCYAALVWVVEHADRLGVDVRRVSIGGSSAGGNLAAAVALLARDRGGPVLYAQVLDIPVVDLTMSHPSIEELRHNRALPRQDLVRAIDFYIGNDTDPTHPLVSPFYADVRNLPPALIMTAECDPLRDEAEAYGHRLREAGVPSVIRRWPGMVHGSTAFAKIVPEIVEAQDREVADFLTLAYGSALDQAGSTP